MKKHIRTLFLTFCMICLLIPATVLAADETAGGTCGENLTWSYDESTETLTISGTGPMTDYEKGGAPWYEYADRINTLMIEEGVTTIGEYAFYHCTLGEGITIPSTITEMHYDCFAGIMDGISGPIYISDLSAWCKIQFGRAGSELLCNARLYLNGELVTNVTIPSDVNGLYGAFYYYGYLVNAVIPENVTYISGDTFSNCSQLQAVVFLGDALPDIQERSFYNTSAILYYPQDNSTYTEEYLNERSGTNVWIPYTAESDFCFIDQSEEPMLEDGYVLFHAVAIGEDLTYQWQYRDDENADWTDLDLESASTPLLSMVYDEEITGQVQCVVTNGDGDAIVSEPVDIQFPLLYEYAPKRVEDTIRYLNEIYIDQYPELGLRFRYGNSENHRILMTLAETITEGCTTDREKADAIARWVDDNVTYVLDCFQPGIPTWTFYHRTGVCFNYALLIETLLRCEGIPAAWSFVWWGNTKTHTVADMNHDLQESDATKNDNHAVCWAYVDNQWVMYNYSTSYTDPDEIAEYFYIIGIDQITPVYESDTLPPVGHRDHYYYIDGKFMALANDMTVAETFAGFYVNFHVSYRAQTCYAKSYSSQSYRYLDKTKDTNLAYGEFFRDGFVGSRHTPSFGLAYENGILAAHSVLVIDGERYLTSGSTSMDRLYVPEGEYFILDTDICVYTGYHGKVLAPDNLEYYIQGGQHTITWSSEDPEIATVDQNGTVTAHTEGKTFINLTIVRNSDGAYNYQGGFPLEVYQEAPVFDFTDVNRTPSEANGVHEHIYSASVDMPTCETDGMTTYTCECGHSYTRIIPSFGHDYFGITNNEGNCTAYGCVICGDCYSVEHEVPETQPTEPEPTEPEPTEPEPTDPEPTDPDPTDPDHIHGYGEWIIVKHPSGTEEGLMERYCECGAKEQSTIRKRTNPFTDVKASDYYFEPVLWAVDYRITAGVSTTKFAPNQACTRAQVVTFLWRAAGEPQPASSKNPFRDVKSSAYYYNAVLWAVEQGITTGTGKTTFSPNDPCTRGQVVTFLHRAAGSPEPETTKNPFSDVKKTGFYYDAVLWAVENGITTGISATKFGPGQTCTRAQVVTFLYRAFAR